MFILLFWGTKENCENLLDGEQGMGQKVMKKKALEIIFSTINVG